MSFLKTGQEEKNKTLGKYIDSDEIAGREDELSTILAELNSHIKNEDPTIIDRIRRKEKSTDALEIIIDDFLSKTDYLSTYAITAEKLKKEIIDHLIGWGKLQELIDDPEVTEIFTNEDLEVVKRVKSKDYMTNLKFESVEELEKYINFLTIRVGGKLNRDKCTDSMFDELYDMRIEAAINGHVTKKHAVVSVPNLTLRKYQTRNFTEEDFLKNGTFTKQIAEFFEKYTEDSSILVTGAPEHGKTTITEFIQKKKDPMRRLIRIQDEPESNVKSKNSVTYSPRKLGDEDTRKAYGFSEFSSIAKRQSGKDLYVLETRGSEANDIIGLSDVGYNLLTSCHGHSIRSGLENFEHLAFISNTTFTHEQMLKKICSMFTFVVYVERKKIVEIAEIIGYDREKDHIDINMLFKLKLDENGEFYYETNPLTNEFMERYELSQKLKERRV